MRLIKPSFEIWEQSSGLEGVYKQIERAGRVCYKSEDKMTEDSAKSFVDRMIKSGHGAMLEHGKETCKLMSKYAGDENTYASIQTFLSGIGLSEQQYLSLIEDGWKPQQARAVLPNALKTELVVTGFVSDWKHFFFLRTPMNAHPQARELAIPLQEEFIERKYINN